MAKHYSPIGAHRDEIRSLLDSLARQPHAPRNALRAIPIASALKEQQALKREKGAANKGPQPETVKECIKAVQEGQRNGSVPKKYNAEKACRLNPGMNGA